MIATPIFDLVAQTTPYPATFIDTTFRWESFVEAVHRVQPPKPGVKPQPRKRTAKARR